MTYDDLHIDLMINEYIAKEFIRREAGVVLKNARKIVSDDVKDCPNCGVRPIQIKTTICDATTDKVMSESFHIACIACVGIK